MISGSNGAGKTSILAVLAGMYSTEEGQILIHEIPKALINSESYRKQTGVYLGNETLFDGTVFENIGLGRKIDSLFLDKILDGLNLKEFISSLRLGMDSILGNKGFQPSSSVRQKLIMARTLVTNPKLLILEDPLQYLDNADRKSVIDFITSDDKIGTLIVASNDKYLVRKCDQVFLIENGQIQDQQRTV